MLDAASTGAGRDQPAWVATFSIAVERREAPAWSP